MTASEWRNADFHRRLDWLRKLWSARKSRLFACACARACVAAPASDDVIAAAERFADGVIPRTVLVARRASITLGGNHPDEILTRRALVGCSVPSAETAIDNVLQTIRHCANWPPAVMRARLGTILNEFAGNPCRPPEVPRHWSRTVRQLAESLYDGHDCTFALYDALLEAGHAEVAGHFRNRRRRHPKGCWALDLILGKK